MRCVYCMWKLVFTEIINNNNLFIIYCKLTWDHLWYRFHDRHLIVSWPDCTYGSSINCHYCSLMLCISLHMLYFYSIIIICSHIICTCTFPFIFTHSLEFWLLRFARPGLCIVILLIRYLEKITRLMRSWSSFTRSSLFDIFLFSGCNWTQYLFYFFIPMLLYMSYSSDVDSL